MKDRPLTVTEHHPSQAGPQLQVIRRTVVAWLNGALRRAFGEVR